MHVQREFYHILEEGAWARMLPTKLRDRIMSASDVFVQSSISLHIMTEKVLIVQEAMTMQQGRARESGI